MLHLVLQSLCDNFLISFILSQRFHLLLLHKTINRHNGVNSVRGAQSVIIVTRKYTEVVLADLRAARFA